MEKQMVVCGICGSSAKIFNAKANETYIYFQCTGCEGIFMREYQLEDNASCATCHSSVAVLKADKTCIWLECTNCSGIFRSEYRLVRPVAVSAE